MSVNNRNRRNPLTRLDEIETAVKQWETENSPAMPPSVRDSECLAGMLRSIGATEETISAFFALNTRWQRPVYVEAMDRETALEIQAKVGLPVTDVPGGNGLPDVFEVVIDSREQFASLKGYCGEQGLAVVGTD